MKKVLLFSAYFWPHRGGVEKYAEEVCARLARKGWSVDVVTSLLHGMNSEEGYKGMRVFRVPTWDLLGGTYPVPKLSVWSLLTKLSGNKYDVVITHTRFFPLSFVGSLFARRSRIPHLHVEHGTAHTGAKPFVFSINWLYDHTIGRFILKSASAVAGISNASCRFVRHLCRRDAVLLPNAVDSSFFIPVAVTSPYKEKVVTFVGRLIVAKGVQDLLNATRRMKNVRVVVVGKGNYEAQLRKMAGSNVSFVGEKSAEEIREILSYSAVFVNPSYAEGLPTSVLEAGAMGVPVIATDVGGTNEIIEDNKSGILVHPRDVDMLRRAIVDLLRDSARAKRMAAELQKKVRERFDWEATAGKTDELLEELVR